VDTRFLASLATLAVGPLVDGYALEFLAGVARPHARAPARRFTAVWVRGLAVVIAIGIWAFVPGLAIGAGAAVLTERLSPAFLDSYRQLFRLGLQALYGLVLVGVTFPLFAAFSAYALSEPHPGLLEPIKAARFARNSAGYLRAWGVSVAVFAAVRLAGTAMLATTDGLRVTGFDLFVSRAWSPPLAASTLIGLSLLCPPTLLAAYMLAHWARTAFPPSSEEAEPPARGEESLPGTERSKRALAYVSVLGASTALLGVALWLLLPAM
jgi:hypothetical protein